MLAATLPILLAGKTRLENESGRQFSLLEIACRADGPKSGRRRTGYVTRSRRRHAEQVLMTEKIEDLRDHFQMAFFSERE